MCHGQEERSVNESVVKERRNMKRKSRRSQWRSCCPPGLAIFLPAVLLLAGCALFLPGDTSIFVVLLLPMIPAWGMMNENRERTTIRNAGLVASDGKFIAFYRAENLERGTRYSVEGWLEIHDRWKGETAALLHAEKESYVDGSGETSGAVSLTFELPEGLSMKDIVNEQIASRTLDREQMIRRYSVEPCGTLIARGRK